LATVITNLLSAIPWLGQSLVEFVWGGLYTDEPHNGDIMLKIKILLIARKSPIPILEFTYGLFLNLKSIINVKIAKTWRQLAEVRSIHTSEAFQRLHAGDLLYTYLVGVFEGDDYFSVSKKGKYLTYELDRI
jgi:hypothetical protein